MENYNKLSFIALSSALNDFSGFEWSVDVFEKKLTNKNIELIYSK